MQGNIIETLLANFLNARNSVNARSCTSIVVRDFDKKFAQRSETFCYPNIGLSPPIISSCKEGHSGSRKPSSPPKTDSSRNEKRIFVTSPRNENNWLNSKLLGNEESKSR